MYSINFVKLALYTSMCTLYTVQKEYLKWYTPNDTHWIGPQSTNIYLNLNYLNPTLSWMDHGKNKMV